MNSMNSRKGSRLTLPFLAVLVLAALPFVLKVLAPDAAVFTSGLSPRALLWIGGLAKLTFLVAATVLSWRSASAFERQTPAYSGWRRLGWGFLESSIGQAYLSVSQVSTGVPVLFPSPADIFFLLAYAEFIYALLAFLRGYKESGYPIGTAGERRATALVTALVCAVIAFPVLKPILESGAGAAEKALNVAYTLFDLILLIPTVVLLRITLRFPGGAVWRVWIALLGGFVFVCAGDILFAWFTGFSMPRLDPVVDLMYIAGYGCLALGTAYQRELVA